MSKDRNRKFLGSGFAFTASAVAFAAMIGMASHADAAILHSGDVGPTAVVPTGLPTLPAGDTLVPGATETNTFVGIPAGHFSGTLSSSVYSDPITGGLDFVYEITSDATSGDDIERLSLSSFAGFTTDADYTNQAITDTDPSTADRSGSGSVVGFNFGSGLAAGHNTALLIVETNADNFTFGAGSVIDGAVGGAIVEAPSVGMLTVPEPTTFAVISVVGGLLLGRRRR